MKAITNKRLTKLLWISYIIIVMCMLVATCSCTSKSGQLAKQPIVLEKVVIIDRFQLEKVYINSAQQMYKYKVKRMGTSISPSYNLHVVVMFKLM